MINHYPINPVSKPRMTRSDKWKKRSIVMKFWAFKDAVREAGVKFPPQGASIVFVLEMPKSWSKKKRKRMNGQPHKQTPDLSNLIKGLEDCVYEEDSIIWHYAGLQKRWGLKGEIVIEEGR